MPESDTHAINAGKLGRLGANYKAAIFFCMEYWWHISLSLLDTMPWRQMFCPTNNVVAAGCFWLAILENMKFWSLVLQNTCMCEETPLERPLLPTNIPRNYLMNAAVCVRKHNLVHNA